ncbi:hypothetical protein [Verminephrobacter aporrectodeae]|uniref:hypothetical protein n=1 Tax=Verminephrobacter aporrectodeae TaxID=1110389 RepID=UPI0022431485|nr:hypothetical protein [Verminephrobacter aporrectodeae]
MNTNITVAIVDPTSAGHFIAQRALERGFLCAAIFSASAESSGMDVSWSRACTDKDFDALIARDAYDAIIPGAESGVCLAEELAARFGLAGNDPQTTAWRRNKSPTLFELSHDDPEALEADIRRIRELERSAALWEIA